LANSAHHWSRCDCISTRTSTLSSAMLRIAVAVLSSLLNTRSGWAVDTGSVAKICSRVLIFGRVSPWQDFKAATAVFISAASSCHSHLCFHIVNSLLNSYSDRSSSECSSTAGCSVAASFVMKAGISPISDSAFSWEEPKPSVKWMYCPLSKMYVHVEAVVTCNWTWIITVSSNCTSSVHWPLCNSLFVNCDVHVCSQFCCSIKYLAKWFFRILTHVGLNIFDCLHVIQGFNDIRSPCLQSANSSRCQLAVHWSNPKPEGLWQI